MRVLVITPRYPMFDRASGDFRLFQMLKILADRHQIVFTCYEGAGQAKAVGEAEARRYRDALIALGIQVNETGPLSAMQGSRFDAILFEFHFAVELYMGEARVLQPDAVKIVDSVDVGFNRLFAKARLTGAASDVAEAERKKRTELMAYRSADHVIAVSDEDRRILLAAAPDLSVGVVPNIHPTLPLDDGSEREADSMLFVGNFRHEPNRDAILYFCEEILPLIRREVPGARLRIVGDPVPPQVRALEGQGIEVLGHVPDLEPYLRTTRISVAPLRYGGGMKGKVGEALSAGLPVVTTPYGVEGFGLVPGRDALVASNPQEFSTAVVRLLSDPSYYAAVREAGWRFVVEHYSVEPVARQFLGFLDQATAHPTRPQSIVEKLRALVPVSLRHSLLRAIRAR